MANDDQLITQYLLGTVADEEAERLDEMSIADDEFAARLQAVENDLVDAYVSGELSGQALEGFQTYYLSSPKRREKVAVAQGLKDFIGRMLIDRQTERAPQEVFADSRADKPKGFLRRYFWLPEWAIPWGVAVAVLLVILAGGYLMLENLRLRNQIHQAQVEREELQRRQQELQTRLQEHGSVDAQAERELENLRQQLARLEQQLAQQGAKSPSTVPATEPHIFAFALAPQTRSAGQMATLSIPADTDYVTLQLELEPNDYTLYRAELKPQPGNAVVWKSASLRARAKNDGKTVSVRLRLAHLQAERYIMEVYGVSPTGASETIGSYPFKVVKQ